MVLAMEKAYVVDEDYRANDGSGFANEGYTLTAWNSMADGSGARIGLGAPYAPRSDTTLYAQWKKNEEPVRVVVYTWRDATKDVGLQYDYSVEFTEPGGEPQYTTGQDNTVYFTRAGEWGTMRVSAPGLFIYPGTDGDEKFIVRDGGAETEYTNANDYFVLDGSAATRTFTFKIGEFKTLYVHKMPNGESLQLTAKFHRRAGNYGDGGILFGGHRYQIHWYDDMVFSFRPGTDSRQSVSAEYTYNESDDCFVNVAHLGTAPGHVMHAWLGYAYEIGGTIDRYSELSTYSMGDRVVKEFSESKGYPYCVVYEYINDTPGKNKSLPRGMKIINAYWKACNGNNGENIYVKDYVDEDSAGPFQAISAVD